MIVTQAIQNSLVQTLPGWGGVGITAFQVMATVTNFNAPVSSAPYSKFAHSIDSQSQTMVASKSGMTIIYLPALLASTCLYLANSFEMLSVSPLASLLVILHFLKRVLEVQFLHKYSGTVGLGTSSMIGTYYALTAALICSIAEPVSPVVTAIGIGKLISSF
jgi:very-long-chain enoyl-CoA reductase